jgi:hypothetical protein
MIGDLPTTLTVGNQELEIRTDYRIALRILVAYQDAELNPYERVEVLLRCLYVEPIENIANIEKAAEKAVWFLNGGNDDEPISGPKIMDWEQDEQLIFSSVNKVAGTEGRSAKYIHWWTFLGYMQEIEEGLLTTILNIRRKKATGKKLEKYEKEFYEKNVDLIKLKPKYTEKEKQEREELLKKLRGG